MVLGITFRPIYHTSFQSTVDLFGHKSPSDWSQSDLLLAKHLSEPVACNTVGVCRRHDNSGYCFTCNVSSHHDWCRCWTSWPCFVICIEHNFLTGGFYFFWYIHLLMFNIELGCPFSQRGRAKHCKRWAYPSSDGSRTRSSMGDTGDEACWRMANNGQNYIWVCFCVITVASLFDVFVETIPHVIVLNWIWSLRIFLWPSYVNLRTRAASSISILLSIGRRWKNWCLWKDRRWKIIGWLLFVFLLAVFLKKSVLASSRPLPDYWAYRRYNLHWFYWYHEDWPSWLWVVLPSSIVSVLDAMHLVRSAISIVPQSPDLFEGTIRDNIDPLGVYSDADIWVALEQVHCIFLLGQCLSNVPLLGSFKGIHWGPLRKPR